MEGPSLSESVVTATTKPDKPAAPTSTAVPDSSRVDPGVITDPDRTVPFVPTSRDSDGETSPIAMQDRKDAHDVAEQIIDAKINEIRAKYTDKGQVDTASMSNAEFDIYSIHVLHTRGFSKSEFRDNPTGIPLFNGEGLQITGKDNDGADVDTTALAIKEQQVDARGRLVAYVCYTTDPGDPTKTVSVSPSELTKSFMTKIAPSISEAVEPDQKSIVEWYSQGEKGTPPTEAVKKEKDPMIKANQVITKRIQELKADIDKLDKGDRSKREGVIARLEFALKADGEELGAFIKMDALRKIATDKLGTPDAQKIDAAMGALEQKAEEAKNNFTKLAESAGIDKKVLRDIEEQGLDVLLKNNKLREKFLSTPGIEQKVFGTATPSDAEVDAMANEHLTPEQKADLEASGGKKGILLAILLLLLASPVIAAGAIAVGASAGVKTLSGVAQQ